ncbi:MAG: site-specific integrase, partial [Chloroflexi bacterium]|nr:site-specific integrase [Chloroflexota bacterium]
CRRSEICGLQWSDVDFDRSLVYIRRSYHVVAGVEMYREPKSARSRRAIALDAYSLNILADQRADAERLAGMFGRPLAQNAPVFARANGRPLHPETITKAWVRVARALRLSVRLHDLRHSSATLMLAAGIPVQLVSQRLGHATAGFTLTQYAGVLPGAQVEAAEKLAALLNGHSKAPAPALAGTTEAG